MNLTVAYVTARRDPRINWFFDSLRAQSAGFEKIIVVDNFAESEVRREIVARQFRNVFDGFGYDLIHVPPKPNIWNGPHRLTKEDWWAKSNALNTAICLCKTDWIAFVDDRSVLVAGWCASVREATMENYAVCGTYEKRANMEVKSGQIINPGAVLGVDHRPQDQHTFPTKDWYGGHGALPLEWCLKVNGFSEDLCDSLGSEDSMFGCTLFNSGYPIRYDPRMKIIEDRTPGEIDGALKRADKGVSPNDKSHAIVSILRDKTHSQNSYDIRNMRDRILNGEPFPPPSASHFDWFDGQAISEMT